MTEKYFKEYFWHYPRVVITDVKTKTFVFDQGKFFSEAKKFYQEYFNDKERADSHFVAFQAYLISNVAISHLAERVNTAMRLLYENIINGNEGLNENTPFYFTGVAAIEALEGIFTAYHDTSLRNKYFGRFDATANPLSYDNDNLVIRLTYYKKASVLTKLLKKNHLVSREELIESKRIKEISGDSSGMIVSLFDGQALLKVTPHTIEWVRP